MIPLIDDLFAGKPWDTLIIFKELCEQLKADYPLPAYADRIAQGTSDYEKFIRMAWEDFKLKPTDENAQQFVALLIDYAKSNWQGYMADVLGVDADDLSLAELELLENQINDHIGYLTTSLLPDIIHAIKDGLTDFSKFDYRVIFLYSGVLWKFGFLATVMFDGLQPRDAGDIFIFLGPDDENTCDGPNGCQRHVGKAYTVAEILADGIYPGNFRCLTSCRHILIPFLSL